MGDHECHLSVAHACIEMVGFALRDEFEDASKSFPHLTYKIGRSSRLVEFLVGLEWVIEAFNGHNAALSSMMGRTMPSTESLFDFLFVAMFVTHL